jgi:hypothetical protein
MRQANSTCGPGAGRAESCGRHSRAPARLGSEGGRLQQRATAAAPRPAISGAPGLQRPNTPAAARQGCTCPQRSRAPGPSRPPTPAHLSAAARRRAGPTCAPALPPAPARRAPTCRRSISLSTSSPSPGSSAAASCSASSCWRRAELPSVAAWKSANSSPSSRSWRGGAAGVQARGRAGGRGEEGGRWFDSCKRAAGHKQPPRFALLAGVRLRAGGKSLA